MIDFSQSKKPNIPIKILNNFYKIAHDKKQEHIEAATVSSIHVDGKYADSRYVNLKYITNDSLIFFSNYSGVKSSQFEHNPVAHVTVLIYWSKTGTQIRMRGPIKKCNKSFSDLHFISRSIEKNALAISSKQSNRVSSYKEVLHNFNRVLENENLKKRPPYWGGYQIKPVYFEFWQSNNYRINKREVYEYSDKKWNKYFLEP